MFNDFLWLRPVGEDALSLISTHSWFVGDPAVARLDWRRDRDGKFVCTSLIYFVSCCLHSRPDSLYILHIRPQYLRYTPCLCYTAARPMRRVTFEDFGDVPKSRFAQLVLQWLQPLGSLFASSTAAVVHFNVSRDERPEQPRPDCPLVIGSVALDWTAGVPSFILGVARRKAAQAVRREQMLSYLLDHSFRALR